MEKEIITTAEEARQKAIDWQVWQAEQSLSYDEMAEWENYFNELADQFDLHDEFKENAII